MDDTAHRQRLTGRQLRDLAGLALMVVGAVLTCVAGFILHPAAGLALCGGWLVAAGWLAASTEVPDLAEGPGLEGGR
ncbi:hypothetical protein ACGFJC_47490 [Nonomuraea fuscirosea]|uniref:hypothetical protein n=1 Tax=Nonomuraea fuscirosea TaxID=1291556 RepID=UPI0037198DBC